MKPQNNWQDALSSLLQAPNLPIAPEEENPTAPTAPKQTGKLNISYERKGRGGKEVTIISGFTIDHDQLTSIASTLKQRLGCGGSARGAEILLQGDRRNSLPALLKELNLSK